MVQLQNKYNSVGRVDWNTTFVEYIRIFMNFPIAPFKGAAAMGKIENHKMEDFLVYRALSRRGMLARNALKVMNYLFAK
jgi:hypothetical protein